MIDPKKARQNLGFTQVQMATACNTSVWTVAKWDQGKRTPRGQAERLVETLLWLKEKGLMEEYLDRFQ